MLKTINHSEAQAGNAPAASKQTFFQPKLAVNEPGDAFEQEADAMADMVMRMPSPATSPGEQGCFFKPARGVVQRECQHCAEEEAPIQRKCKACEEEEHIVRRKGSGEGNVPQTSPAVEQALGSSGQPLDGHTRTFMEQRFGHDFGQVQIHNDGLAHQSSADIDARAYTHGNHIVFSAGQYQPGTDQGKHLLAHELTHVIQQSSAKDDDEVQTIRRKPGFLGPCLKLLEKPSIIGLMSGSAVHAAISAHFRETVSGARGIAIPGAKADPQRTSGICGKDSSSIEPEVFNLDPDAMDAGIPDLARLKKGVLEVAEIKPAAPTCVVDGEIQLERYIQHGNDTDDAILKWRFRKGILAGVIPMLPSTYRPKKLSAGGFTIETAWCTPGLMVYNVSKGKPGKKEKEKEKEEKQKEKENEKKGEKENPEEKTSAAAENAGLGLSLWSSSSGAANAGVGVSIMSNGVGVGNVSAGVVYDSNGAALGTAGAGVSISSDSAQAAAAGVTYSEDSTAAGAANASIGSSKENTSAAAATAAVGSQEGVTDAQAAKAGAAKKLDTPDGKGKGDNGGSTGQDPGKQTTSPAALNIPGVSASEAKKAVDAALTLDAKLRGASQAQRDLMVTIARQQPHATFPISKVEWIDKMLFATNGLKDEDLKFLQTVTWEPGALPKEKLRENIQEVLQNKNRQDLHFNAKQEIKVPLASREIIQFEITGIAMAQDVKIVQHGHYWATIVLVLDTKDGKKTTIQIDDMSLICTKVKPDPAMGNNQYDFDFNPRLEISDLNGNRVASAKGMYANENFISF